MLLKSENFELMNCVIITEDCGCKISSQNYFFVIFNIFRSEAQESVFCTANHYCLILPLNRGYLMILT